MPLVLNKFLTFCGPPPPGGEMVIGLCSMFSHMNGTGQQQLGYTSSVSPIDHHGRQ